MIVLVLLALVGTTLIIVRSTLLGPIRRLWPPLLACAQCTGTWVGAAAGGFGLLPAGHGHLLDALVVGAATSFLSQLADAILLTLLGDPGDPT